MNTIINAHLASIIIRVHREFWILMIQEKHKKMCAKNINNLLKRGKLNLTKVKLRSSSPRFWNIESRMAQIFKSRSLAKAKTTHMDISWTWYKIKQI